MGRRSRSSDEEKKGAPEWMTTYGDMVTLLLCFFVLLFAFSEIDAQKFEAVIQSFQGSLGILDSGRAIEPSEYFVDAEMNEMMTKQVQELEALKELEEIANELKEFLESRGYSQAVDIQFNERYVKLNFLDGVLFDPGKAIIKQEAIPVLEAVALKLVDYSENRIKIEGHTDTVPIRTIEYPNNWYLAAARAIAVAEYYINEKGYDPKRLSAEGFGEYAPIATNDTPEGRTRNRRVEIKILNRIESQRVTEEELEDRGFN